MLEDRRNIFNHLEEDFGVAASDIAPDTDTQQVMMECNQDCCQVIINGRVQEVDDTVINLQRQINIDASSAHEDTTLPTYEEAVMEPTLDLGARTDAPIEHTTTTPLLPTYEEAVMEPTTNHGVAIYSPTQDQATIASLPLTTSEDDNTATHEEPIIITQHECVVGNLYIYKGNGTFDLADYNTGDKLIKTQDGLEKLADTPNGATLTITGNFSFNYNH
jgi:hypothetical protein